MPIRKDPDGRRSIEAEVEVPGSPEEVWQAIATGPGISAWFVPSTVDGRVDGAATANFGPGMESQSKIKLWDPPKRFVAESVEGPGPVATEWIVEGRDGGVCVVRVVHSWFASTDDWDNQFEGHAEGWKAFFRNLRLYLSHFRGEPSAAFQLTGFAPEPKAGAWERLMTELGIRDAAVGRRVQAAGSSPGFAGLVERVGVGAWSEELLVRLDQPAPGVAHLFAMPIGGQVLLSIRLYLYGQQASAVVNDIEPKWQSWVNRHFPAKS